MIILCLSYLITTAPLAFWSKNYWGQLNHHLMANIWEKAKSILARNLISSLSYLITTVHGTVQLCCIARRRHVFIIHHLLSELSLEFLLVSLSFSLLALNPQLKSYFLTRDRGPPHQLGILSCPIFRFLLELACAQSNQKMFFLRNFLFESQNCVATIWLKPTIVWWDL